MEIIVSIWMFMMGTIFGSFYNVVGLRLPKGESIVSPGSHCMTCNHKLTAIELIPIISYFLSKGKCKHCGAKISYIYPLFEAACGLLFALSYLSFGLTPDLIIALTFISMMVIIVVSDYSYLIIPDSILIIFGSLLAFEITLISGFETLFTSLMNGLGAMIFMFALKNGGDIKLMFIIGFVLSFPLSIVSVFLASLIGLPISLIYLNKSNDHVIPFGPFLALGSIILLLMQLNIDNFIAL